MRTIAAVSLRAGVWTVVFTDLVDSTAQRARVGDVAADALRREHDRIVADAVAQFGGEVVKGLGDGSMCAFESAAAALDATVAIIQALRERNRTADQVLEVRIGVSLGEISSENDDLYGLAVNEAARLCAAAAPGEVLVADVVRVVVASRTTVRMLPHEPVDLKGFAEPRTVWTLDLSELAASAAFELPEFLVARDRMAFAGRAAELTALVDAWKGVAGGDGRRAILISGEPGIGKTRLAGELARRAHRDGAQVLFGRCDDGLTIAFQPFAEVLDWYFARALNAPVLGRFPADLARLVPAVSEYAPAVDTPLQADPDSEQYRLFEAVASWISALSETAPLVLVLDDLHWATRPTLMMLRHVLRMNTVTRLLVLVTYRDTELDRRHPLSNTLADLRREPGVQRVALNGLDADGIIELLEAFGEQSAGDEATELASQLRAETEGNPFFIGEVLRHLAEEGRLVRLEGRWKTTVAVTDIGIPQGIKEVVGQRLDRLGNPADEILQVASIVGRDFAVRLLVAIADRDESVVVDALGAALRAGLVEEIDADHYRFSHALVQGVLSEEVTAARRARIHRDIALQVENDPETPAAIAAHHWLEAGSAGDTDRTVAAVLSAARDARSRGAYEEAVLIIEHGADYARAVGATPEIDLELRVSLGEAQQSAGVAHARDTLLSAARDALAAGDATRLGRAMSARTFGFVFDALNTDSEHLELLTRAVEMVEDSALRFELMLRVALEYSFLDPDYARSVMDDAIALAERIGAQSQRFQALGSYAALHWNDPAAEQWILSELTKLDDDAPVPARDGAMFARLMIAMNRGDLQLARAAVAERQQLLALAPVAYLKHITWLGEGTLAHVAGRLEDAKRWNRQALELASSIGRNDGLAYWVVLEYAISRDEGSTSDVVATIRMVTSAAGDSAAGKYGGAVLTVALCDVGERSEVSTRLAAELARGFPLSTCGHNMTMNYMFGYSEAACAVRHVGAAEFLFDRLHPYSGRFFYDFLATHGAVDRVLGRLATVLGRYDEAERFLAGAAQHHERVDAPLFLARTLADQAALTIASGGSNEHARDLVARAVEISRRHAADGTARYAEEVLQG